MHKVVIFLYDIYQLELYKFTHYCMWVNDCERLDRIHKYAFTGGLTTNFSTSLQYRKEKDKNLSLSLCTGYIFVFLLQNVSIKYIGNTLQ